LFKEDFLTAGGLVHPDKVWYIEKVIGTGKERLGLKVEDQERKSTRFERRF
jgi:hypothetical protein